MPRLRRQDRILQKAAFDGLQPQSAFDMGVLADNPIAENDHPAAEKL